MDSSDMSNDLFLMFEPNESESVSPVSENSTISAQVESLRQGDGSVFGQLYARFAPMVHGILLARVPRNDVDDLVQDVFLHALERLHTLRENGAFGGWLAAMARNRAHDFYRNSRKTEELLESSVHAHHSEPETDASRILAVVKKLPEAYRETLILRLVEGMTGPEIAACTGLTQASVRVNLHRGMKLLRDHLGVKKES